MMMYGVCTDIFLECCACYCKHASSTVFDRCRENCLLARWNTRDYILLLGHEKQDNYAMTCGTAGIRLAQYKVIGTELNCRD